MKRMTPLLRKRFDMLKDTECELSVEIEKRVMSAQAVFDRVLLWQVPESWYCGDTFIEGGLIHTPLSTRERHMQDTPRGIIVSAGLNAMDAMCSHGMGIGHVVHFCVNSLYRRPLDTVDGGKHLCLIRVGDIIDSEDLADAIDAGVVNVFVNKSEHRLVDAEGKTWEPKLPWIDEEG